MTFENEIRKSTAGRPASSEGVPIPTPIGNPQRPAPSSQRHRKSEDYSSEISLSPRSSHDGKSEKDFDGQSREDQSLLVNTDVATATALTHVDENEQPPAEKEKPVTWRSLPRKDQLLVLMLSRLSEPLTQTSLGSYLFYQLRSFDPSLPDSTISWQAGLIQSAFPASQFLTAMLWGRFADSEWGGRKRVVLLGLLGTMLSILGFGFSQNFATAVFFRCLGGILNGNIGVMRTMISETIKEKKYQSRAFIILPMTFNIGVIIGPVLGGLLADPVGSYPSIFGPGSALGGKHGVRWMIKYPYATPNIMSAIFLSISAMMVFLFLEETLETLQHQPDYGLRIGRWIRGKIFRHNVPHGYSAVPDDDNFVVHHAPTDVELQPTPTSATPQTPNLDKPFRRQKLPFRRIWTRNVILTFISHGLLAMHVGTFNGLWYIYLSAPRFDPKHPKPANEPQKAPFRFTGGLALPPPRIGMALAILGVIGINLQLILYPRLSFRLGTARSYRIFTWLFPVTYTLAPYLVLIPSTTRPPAGASGFFVWMGITVVLAVQVLARTFALPAAAILINNCCPHPSVLGTVHGLGQSVSSFTRTFGPVMGGWILGRGLEIGIVGIAWWSMALVAITGAFAATFVKDGDGHEILLEGEERGEDGVVRRVG